ncbi:hypothetical protein GLOIN_2v1697782 [Rhizophagus irregularis DAOM 181602=DAOM 197198]|uniref:Uncharacterized protein n=1 Tax=Rhizophagus irregularis (strain DAOM 181602 / DAOM 197198 / MUCL 43194) TaxID=747089 RepID=A0A2P4PA68_RHIID|nr:hypothetical protein GLOIN_2v1697782 [Rhizophagus irregularis DAOM 181602=DAOM 197198]POG62278.1 hypothetical protein GLOIN_2v1697782 [Rhizophagus irregularis DAOM 181602=DAOM 197198]GET56380.1 hypothetical protein GLOIN_2v1697782 [Rhizophagus irregularis DAOM 181602=DAOM 197198]|eukprot:XP_025169144.1 hypothetical protein GLOIN_2v1697782 [Rhizophagus irregularis DAOM 181602=DAOM 197198]
MQECKDVLSSCKKRNISSKQSTGNIGAIFFLLKKRIRSKIFFNKGGIINRSYKRFYILFNDVTRTDSTRDFF